MNELAKIIDESGVDKTEAQTVLEKFTEFFTQASEWEKKVKGLVITDPKQIDDMKLAREGRLQLRQVRVAAEKTKKKLKENILIKGRLIDGIYNAVVAVTKPLEDDLLEKEKFIERLAEKEKEVLKEQRINELTPYDVDLSLYDLGNMKEDKYQELLHNSYLLHNAKIEAEKKIEEQKVENDRKQKLNTKRILKTSKLAEYIDNYDSLDFGEMAENEYMEMVNDAIAKREEYEKKQEQIRLENEKLKKEAEEREAQIKADQEAEEKKRIEASRIAYEKATKEKAKADAEKKAIQDKLDKEREDRVKKEQEEKAKADQLKADQQKKEKAPDKVKLLLLAESIESIIMPEIKNEELKVILDKAKKTLLKLSFDIKSQIK